MNRTRVVIQSRLNSSRLPGKALMMLSGMPLVELVARRASRSGHEVVVATSAEPYDDLIARHCASVGIAVVRGPLDDVLARFVLATADLAAHDRVVRLTGDNPFGDAALVDELLAAVDDSPFTYGRVDIDHVPEGLGAEVFTVGALRAADATTHDAYDREHVTPWLRRELGELLHVPAGSPTDVPAYRATVDTLHDFVRVSTVFDGVEDPVGAPWQDLVAGLVRMVDDLGPRVPQPASGPWSPLVLSARRFSEGGHGFAPAEHAEALRALVAEALDRGVSHVEVGGNDGGSAELLRACTEPSLTQRLGLVLRVAAGGGPGAPDLATRIEHDLARLGRRRVHTLVLEDLPTGVEEDGDARWAVARAYRDAGVATCLGVVARSSRDLARAAALDDLGWVELPAATDEQDPALVDLRGRGVALAVLVGDARSGPVPSWATVHVVPAVDRGELDPAIAALAAGT